MILLDKDLHRKTIVYRELDGSMCNPNEVLRALQVMGESKLNNEGNGVEVILKTPKNVCIRLLSPLKIPKSKNDGLLFLKKLCLSSEVKQKGHIVGKRIRVDEFNRMKDTASVILRGGGCVPWEKQNSFKDETVLIKYNEMASVNDKSKTFHVGGSSQKLDRVIDRFMCIINF